MLNIDLRHQTSFVANGQLHCDISWNFVEPVDSLELRVVWNTVGKGTQDIGIAGREILHTPALSGREAISLQLPAQPYSFSGKLVSIVWAIELVALPSEESARVEMTIGPDGQEVVLKAEDVGT